MSAKGKGGKIRNWKKTGQDKWQYQGNAEVEMDIGSKTSRGYPVRLKGSSVKNGPKTFYAPTKKTARRKAAKVRRKIGRQ